MNKKIIPAHFEMLLYMAQPDLNQRQAARVEKLLHTDLDWSMLLDMARRHDLLQALYHHLGQALPAEQRNSVAQSAEALTQWNMLLTVQLLRLIKLFEAQRIPLLPFKGPVLTAILYRGLAFRRYGDLDIVIHQQDFSRAKEVLTQNGYEPHYHQSTITEKSYWQYKECQFRQIQGDIWLELHWQITSQRFFFFSLDQASFWERTQPVALAGQTVQTFTPENLLLILCVHGSKHRWERLKWLADVAQLLRVYPGLDWDELLGRANRLGARRMLDLGLQLAHNWLEAPLPPAVWQTVSSCQVTEQLADEIATDLIAARDVEENRRYFFRLRERRQDQARQTVRYARYLLLPRAPDFELLALPGWLYSLYYPLRLGRLAWKHTVKAIRSLGSKAFRRHT